MNFLNGYKTYIGILFTILGALATLMHWTFAASLPDWQNSVITLVGAVIAIIGRASIKTVPITTTTTTTTAPAAVAPTPNS